jgi:hypothetical protein
MQFHSLDKTWSDIHLEIFGHMHNKTYRKNTTKSYCKIVFKVFKLFLAPRADVQHITWSITVRQIDLSHCPKWRYRNMWNVFAWEFEFRMSN